METGPISSSQVEFSDTIPFLEPRSVVRTPILDLHGRVYAFRLSYRPIARSEEPGETDQTGLLETAASYRLDKPSELKKITGGMPAVVDCAESMLNERLCAILPASLTVVGLPGHIQPTPENIASCQALKKNGFRLVLPLSSWDPEVQPLLDLADLVAIDLKACDAACVQEILTKVGERPIPLLARNVDSSEQQQQARAAGFTLFEGFFFCQPPMKRNRRPPVNQLLRIELLKALQQRPLEVAKVSDLVKRDGPLTYQLLRIANSPVWGLRQEVQSIERALLAVGDDAFRRIATTAVAAEFNGDQPAELLCLALIRARFCEEAGGLTGLDEFAQYLLGLLSLLPAMQGQTMESLVGTLPLPDSFREALLGKENSERMLLSWLEKFERCAWPECDRIATANGLHQQELSKMYVRAVAWAEATLRSAS